MKNYSVLDGLHVCATCKHLDEHITDGVYGAEQIMTCKIASGPDNYVNGLGTCDVWKKPKL